MLLLEAHTPEGTRLPGFVTPLLRGERTAPQGTHEETRVQGPGAHEQTHEPIPDTGSGSMAWRESGSRVQGRPRRVGLGSTTSLAHAHTPTWR